MGSGVQLQSCAPKKYATPCASTEKAGRVHAQGTQGSQEALGDGVYWTLGGQWAGDEVQPVTEPLPVIEAKRIQGPKRAVTEPQSREQCC